jgi:chemotaxis protein MotB
VPNDVAIEGHTDNQPISSARYPSNWELSNARATSVLRYMLDHDGLPASRLSSTGYADTKPVADNATPEGKAKNRRVEIVVLAQVPLTPALNADGTLTAEATGATVITEPATTVATVATGSDTAGSTVPGSGPDPNIIPGVKPDLHLGPVISPAAGTSGP